MRFFARDFVPAPRQCRFWLCQEVALHLAYRWFCKLDLDDKVPHHSTFSVNRLGRFRESEILRHIFERVVAACMAAGLIKGEGFAVDASVMEANASRYHGKAPDELDWTDAQRQKRAVAEYLAGLEAEARDQESNDDRGGGSDRTPTTTPDRKPPKVISPSDPSSAWTRKPTSVCSSGMGSTILSTSSTRSSSMLRRRRHAPTIRWHQPRR